MVSRQSYKTIAQPNQAFLLMFHANSPLMPLWHLMDIVACPVDSM